jgi:hypothetical protein
MSKDGSISPEKIDRFFDALAKTLGIPRKRVNKILNYESLFPDALRRDITPHQPTATKTQREGLHQI